MHRLRYLILTTSLLVLLFVWPHTVSAQPMNGSDLATISIKSERDALVPGETQWIALHFAIEPEWHLYWQNAGDTGEPPTAKWDTPPGITIGDPVWPSPRRYISPGNILDYTFEHELAILFSITVDQDLVPGTELTISAKTDYLICKSLCLFGDGSAKITLPVKAESSPSPDAGVFERTRRFVPLAPEEASSQGVRTQWAEETLEISVPDAKGLAFFPLPERGGATPTNLIETGAATGDALRIAYDGVKRSNRVRAVLEIRYDDRLVYQSLDIETHDRD